MVIGLCALPASLLAGWLWEQVGPSAAFYLSLALTAVAALLCSSSRRADMAGKKWSRCLLFSSALLLVSLADSQERPKVGLVLSGGGAKGVAHVPILKLLVELDFPVDCIAGTSVGGIMGGLYAAGYSGAEIEQFFAGADWLGLFSDRPPRGRQPFFEKRLDGRYQLEFPLRKGLPYAPRGLVAGQNFYNLFSSLLCPLPGDLDFDDLPIPFRCLAVDIVTGNQVILESGSLPRALRATMAIPTLLAPVQWGECLLVDGACSTTSGRCSATWAPNIIAVDLACPLSPVEDLSADKILTQSLQVLDAEQKKANDKVISYPAGHERAVQHGLLFPRQDGQNQKAGRRSRPAGEAGSPGSEGRIRPEALAREARSRTSGKRPNAGSREGRFCGQPEGPYLFHRQAFRPEAGRCRRWPGSPGVWTNSTPSGISRT
jgi:predicted acylesterase/phospholipase RssA